MTTYSKYNIVYRLQKWMDSVPGQTFLNYAYSWGASVVILGTLFKLTHLPGANIMLFIGMGTEVVVFFLSAFDRPFDKTAIGMELPTHLTEEHFAMPGEEGENGTAPESSVTSAPAEGQQPMQAAAQGGTVIIGGTGGGVVYAGGQTGAPSSPSPENPEASSQQTEGGAAVRGVQGGVAYIGQPALSADVAEATSNYIEELQRLTEVLDKVAEQSARLTAGSEEMDTLNRTLTGISRVYEMQLKSASSQIGTIEEINDQTHRMAELIEQLNAIYARMIDAMTTNMGGVRPQQ